MTFLILITRILTAIFSKNYPSQYFVLWNLEVFVTLNPKRDKRITESDCTLCLKNSKWVADTLIGPSVSVLSPLFHSNQIVSCSEFWQQIPLLPRYGQKRCIQFLGGASEQSCLPFFNLFFITPSMSWNADVMIVYLGQCRWGECLR